MRKAPRARIVTWALLAALGFVAPLLGQEPASRRAISRDDHAWIEFWSNYNWASHTYAGSLAEFDAPDHRIGGAEVVLWRLEGAASLSTDEIGKLLLLDLSQLQQDLRARHPNLKLSLVRHARTSARGDFSFPDLSPGIYSLQFDWNTLSSRQVVEVTERRPHQLQSSLAAFVLTRGYQPPAQ